MVPLALMAWCYAKILGSRSHSSGAPTTAQARQRGTRCSWSASAAPPTYRPNPGSSHSLYKSVPAEERHLGVYSGFGGAIAFYVWRETAGDTLSTVVFFSSPTGERCVVETTRELLQNAPAGGSRQVGVSSKAGLSHRRWRRPFSSTRVEGGQSSKPDKFESPNYPSTAKRAEGDLDHD